MDAAAGFAGEPRGHLRVGAGIGFGVNAPSRHLPEFPRRFPGVGVSLDPTNRGADLFPDAVDVAIRMGPLPASASASASALVAARPASLPRFLCAAPSCLARRGHPSPPRELAGHDRVDVPGHARTWTLA